MRRKATVALFLALAMVACSLSAAAAYADGYYGDSYYEVSATIDGRTVYGRTSVLNRDYEAYVLVRFIVIIQETCIRRSAPWRKC